MKRKARQPARKRAPKNRRGEPARARRHYRYGRGEALPDRLSVLEPNAAGIDIGAEVHYVSVPEDRDPEPVQSFGCYTADLERLIRWLRQCRIDTVVMESTGFYWIILYRLLEEAGLRVVLVDPRHVKYVPGRKSDVLDCQWLRQLHSYGLLRAAFVPAADVATLRAYWRRRKELVGDVARAVLQMQKAMTEMNLHLHVALSDITGVSGMRMIRAIVAGERDPMTLARMAHPTVKTPTDEIAQALTGRYTAEHLFALQQALETYDFLVKQIQACDEALQGCLGRFASKPAPPPASDLGPNRSKRNKRKRRKNEPHFDLGAELVRLTGVDLTRLDGIDAMTAFTVLSEIGLTVDAFPSVKHFASWLGLCPAHAITGGKVKRRRTRPVKNRAADALRVAAQSLHRSDSYLGAYYRRMRTRLGAPKAITATAHKLARLIYALLKHGQVYVDKGQAHLEAQHRERNRKNLIRRAAELGLEVLDPETGEILGAA